MSDLQKNDKNAPLLDAINLKNITPLKKECSHRQS